MKFLKIFLGIIVVIIAIILIGSLFLPKTFSVSRSANIAASDTVVYKNIADFDNFLQWNPWSKMDPQANTLKAIQQSETQHVPLHVQQ